MREATQLTKMPSAGRRGTKHIDVRDGSRWEDPSCQVLAELLGQTFGSINLFSWCQDLRNTNRSNSSCVNMSLSGCGQAVALLKWATPLESLKKNTHGTSSGSAGPAVLRYHEELGLFTMCWSWYLQGGNGNIPIPRDVPESPTAEISSKHIVIRAWSRERSMWWFGSRWMSVDFQKVEQLKTESLREEHQGANENVWDPLASTSETGPDTCTWSCG